MVKEQKNKKSLDIFKEQIERAIGQNGSYTHNIIGMVLSDVAKNYGDEEANKLIDEYDLSRWGMVKQEPK